MRDATQQIREAVANARAVGCCVNVRHAIRDDADVTVTYDPSALRDIEIPEE